MFVDLVIQFLGVAPVGYIHLQYFFAGILFIAFILFILIFISFTMKGLFTLK